MIIKKLFQLKRVTSNLPKDKENRIKIKDFLFTNTQSDLYFDVSQYKDISALYPGSVENRQKFGQFFVDSSSLNGSKIDILAMLPFYENLAIDGKFTVSWNHLSLSFNYSHKWRLCQSPLTAFSKDEIFLSHLMHYTKDCILVLICGVR